MTCSYCKKSVDMFMAVFWEGRHWHRSCAVMHQKKEIVKIEKKLKSSGISQIQHAELLPVLLEAKLDLKCLIGVEKDEVNDQRVLGKIMYPKGFGERTDTQKLIESGKIPQNQIEATKKIKSLYGTM